MTAVPIALFWALASWGLLSRRPVLLYMFFATMPFGAFAVLPPQVTAGLTFTPTPIVALLITLRTLASRQGVAFFLTAALMPTRMALLSGFWVVAVFTTMFMPSLFAGHVDVIPVRGILQGTSPLYPTTQNISQLAYLTISIVAVFAFARLMQQPSMRQHALIAMCLGAAVAIVTGLLDFATQFAPVEPLLTPFRTATYALLTDVEVLGGKRVVGLTPEASSYGALTINFLTLLYFFRGAMPIGRLRDQIVPILIVLLVLMTWLATSSSAYVGLALFGMLAGLEWLWRASALRPGARRRRGLIMEFWVVFSAFAALVLIIAVKPSLLDPVMATLDRMVFTKTSSQSFEERSMWTTVSFQALIDTFGLGVGMGGTRASNAAVAVLSNVGVLGSLLYYGFVLQTLLRRPRAGDEEGAALVSGVRWSFPTLFVLGLLAGTTADFGAGTAFKYGLMLAVAYSSRKLLQPGIMPRGGLRRGGHVRDRRQIHGLQPRYRISSSEYRTDNPNQV